MKRKEQYADEIIEILERTKCGAWASNINLNTKDRVIEVCQNCVDSWSGRKFKDHCTTPPQSLEQTRWIPVSERLPEEFESVLVCYESQGGMAQAVSERFGTHTGYKWSALAGIEPIAWMPLPPCYEPQESEVSDADSN